jgi:hypothetical protein
MMILVAGPYRSGTDGDPARIQANVDAMTDVALTLFRRGHLPVMGEWFALPLIEAATASDATHAAGIHGSTSDAPAGTAFDEIFHPVAERVLARCDACLRIGGPSEGADRMVTVARRLGKVVFTDLAEVP